MGLEFDPISGLPDPPENISQELSNSLRTNARSVGLGSQPHASQLDRSHDIIADMVHDAQMKNAAKIALRAKAGQHPPRNTLFHSTSKVPERMQGVIVNSLL